jgi:hypothetical protein
MNDTDNLIDRMMQGLPVKVDEQRICIVTPSMTLPQYAAIHLKVPMSGDPELDQMIRESRRLDFAGQAMEGILSGGLEGVGFETELTSVARRACAFADSLLAQWEKGAGK